MICFNIKDSGHFDKCVLLVQFADTLVCKSGVFGPLGVSEALAFLTSTYISSYYP